MDSLVAVDDFGVLVAAYVTFGVIHHGIIIQLILGIIFQVDSTALNGDGTGPFNGHLANVALWQLFLLFLKRGGLPLLRCVVVEHLPRVDELDPTLFTKESRADGMHTHWWRNLLGCSCFAEAFTSTNF